MTMGSVLLARELLKARKVARSYTTISRISLFDAHMMAKCSIHYRLMDKHNSTFLNFQLFQAYSTLTGSKNLTMQVLLDKWHEKVERKAEVQLT